MRNAHWVLFPALLLFAGGCARFTYNDSVEGTIKMGGKPVPNVVVRFVPEQVKGAPGSGGVTDENGHFTLTCDNGHSGAVVAKHAVVVLPGRGGGADPNADPKAAAGDAKSRPTVPKIYGSVNTTQLHEDVTKDKHTYDLELSSTTGGRQIP